MSHQTNPGVSAENSTNTQLLRSLLSKSPEERLNYFKKFTIAHPNLTKTFDKLWRAILDPQPGSTVMIYGPAGVGKTKLCEYLEKRIIERFAELLETNREKIPFVKVEASNPVSGNFDWKHLFQELLLGLCEPAIDQKLDLAKWRNSVEDYQRIAKNSSNACHVLRDAVEAALKHRNPKAVLIDEAQHMCVMASSRKLVNQPDSIKSIANRTATTHVLFGSYDLLTLRNLNGQLARRTIQLHFKRYDNRNEDDVDVFLDLLNQFQNNLPIKEAVNLVDNWKFVYSRCAGCIGVLKEWLNRSLSMALDENSSKLNMEHLSASALTTSQSERLLDEVLAGEKKIEEDITQESLMSRYKFNTVKKRNDDTRKLKIKKGGRIGVRNPKRDKVGI